MSIAQIPPGASHSRATARVGRWIAAFRRGARKLGSDRLGVTSLEYGIMGSLICAAIAASVIGFANGLGGNMAGTFARLAASM